MKNLILILPLFLAISLSAQDNTHYFGINSNILQNIDISHPRMNIGIERFFSDKSISINIGKFYHNRNYNDTPKNSFSLGGEYKWFTRKGFHYILGAEISNLEYYGKERFELNNENGDFIINDYRIEKHRSELYFNVGTRKSIGKLFYVDCFGGLGIRYKQTKHFDRLAAPEDEINFTVLDLRNKEGDMFVPVLKLGVRFGIKL